jgi:chemotaxis protein CheX
VVNEAEIRTFLEGAVNYFDVSARQPVAVGVPYLVTTGAPPVHDYTGIISVSGRRNGAVCFTAPRSMLMVLLMRMNEPDTSDENMRDLVGEVANTISGNARRDFGKDFSISVPSVVEASGGALALPREMRPVVIPLNWRSHSARLIVCLS